MREIKFRAWDEDDNRMIYHDDGMSVKVYGDDNYITKGSTPINGTLMQFTGLLDRHGKEIYEGDLFRPDILVSPKYLVVEWNSNNAGVEPFFGEEGFNAEKGEVIGNIYENPNLLK